jgi:hypothetical protein
MAKELDEKTQGLVDKAVSKARKDLLKEIKTAVRTATTEAKDEVEDRGQKKAVSDVGKGILEGLKALEA